MTYLTIPDVSVREQTVVGASPQTNFTFSFAFYTESDVEVWLGAGDAAVQQVYATNFTVVGTVGTDGGYIGGTVTFISPTSISNDTVTILLNVPISRSSNLPTGVFDIDALNDDLNRQVSLVQQLNETLARAATLAVGSPLSWLTMPEPVAGQGIMWNGTADGRQSTGRALRLA